MKTTFHNPVLDTAISWTLSLTIYASLLSTAIAWIIILTSTF